MSSAAQLPPPSPSNYGRSPQSILDPSAGMGAMPPVSQVPPLPPPPGSSMQPPITPAPAVVPAGYPASAGVQQASFVPTTAPQMPNLSDPATQALIQATTTSTPPARTPEVAQVPQTPAPQALAPQAPAPLDVAQPVPDHSTAVTPALRIVNSTRFTLGYELRDLGTSGLSTLELWSTSDTRTWTRLPTAHFEAQSCTVTVPGEGTYGFTVVSHDGQRPRAGESPQVWVTVDITKPVVQVQGVDLSLTARPPVLVVRWVARDRNFGPRPVSIAYAEKLDGPWVTLVANVPNTGRCECPIPTGLPQNVFLRVEATDVAGNVGMAQTAQTVHVEPTSDAPRTAALLPPPPGGDFVSPSPVSIQSVEPTGN